MTLFSHAWSLDYNSLVLNSTLINATLGADVMRTPLSRARQTHAQRCPTTTAIRAQPFTNSVMSGRVFLKQVPALSSLYEAAAAEAQASEAVPSTNQRGWIEKPCGPICEKILRVCTGEIEGVSY